MYAVARLDWCRPTTTTGGGPVAQVLCNIQARQCGSFTNATRDAARIGRTAPELQKLLRPPEIDAWHGKCPVAEAQGVCELGGARSYQRQLWDDFAEPREKSIYAVIAGGSPSEPKGPEGAAAASLDQIRTLRPEGTEDVAGGEGVRARGDRVVAASRLLGLPFL